jgi:hypothetical protein
MRDAFSDLIPQCSDSQCTTSQPCTYVLTACLGCPTCNGITAAASRRHITNAKAHKGTTITMYQNCDGTCRAHPPLATGCAGWAGKID